MDKFLICLALVSTALLALMLIILPIVGLWRLFREVDEAGWKALIPIWNLYVVYKIAWGEPVWFFVNLASFVLCIMGMINGISEVAVALTLIGLVCCLACSLALGVRLSHAFGNSTLFGIGIGLLPSIFIYILAEQGRVVEEEFI